MEENSLSSLSPLELSLRTNGGVETKDPVDMSNVTGADTQHIGNIVSWARAIRGEGRPDPTVEDGAHTLAVIEAAVRSSESGRSEQVE